MRTKAEWGASLTQYFASVNRNLDIDSGKDSLKVFCIEEGKDGLVKTQFLSTKLRNMNEQMLTDEQYDKEMRQLINNGSIRFYEEGNIDGKTLSLDKADQSVNNESPEEKLVAKSMGLAHERGGFWSRLITSIKSLFYPQTKINQAAERFFDNYQQERSKEIIPENVEKQNRENRIEKIKQHEKINSQLEKRITAQKIFENNLQSVFGEKTSATSLTEKGYEIDTQKLPNVEFGELAQKYNFCKPENMPYIGLCMAIAAQIENSFIPPNLVQSAIIEKCLTGEYDSEANEAIEKFVLQGKENTSGCLKALKQGDLSTIGTNLQNGICLLNEMMGTCQPEKYIDLNSNCMLTAKCIKETLNIINSNEELKSAVNLWSYDEKAAKGACAMWDIADKSLNAQKELCYSDSCNVKEQAQYIENDIKMRGELCNKAYLSDWHARYRELAAKNPEYANTPKGHTALVQVVRYKKSDCPNVAFYELGENPNCFNADKEKPQIKANDLSKNPHDIMINLSKLIKNNAEMYAQNKHFGNTNHHEKPPEDTFVHIEKQKSNDRKL